MLLVVDSKADVAHRLQRTQQIVSARKRPFRRALEPDLIDERSAGMIREVSEQHLACRRRVKRDAPTDAGDGTHCVAALNLPNADSFRIAQHIKVCRLAGQLHEPAQIGSNHAQGIARPGERRSNHERTDANPPDACVRVGTHEALALECREQTVHRRRRQ